MGDEARRYKQLDGIETATQTTATNTTTSATDSTAISAKLSGDIVGVRKVSVATTYDDDGGLSHVEFPSGVRHVEIKNLDDTNFILVCPQPATDFKAYLTLGTGGTDGLGFQYKTAGTTGNSYQVALIESGNLTALSVVETSATLLTINLETDAGGTAISTPQEVKAACDALGLTYVDVWAWGVSAVSAAGATNLANGADTAAVARASQINQVVTPFWGEAFRVEAGGTEHFDVTLSTTTTRIDLKADTAAAICQVVGLV